MHGAFAFVTAFLASAVEAVEALTIVLAVGVVRGWRSTLIGVAAATAILLATIVLVGPALDKVPIGTLRLIVGALLLVFGLQWLRKAILRSGGFKAMHDEDAAFDAERQLAAGARAAATPRMDWYSFTVAFKGVLLEGLEVVFIVIALGSAQGELAIAALGASTAVALVIAAGLVVHGPLSRVPENTVKFAVGVLLTSFGCFWSAEGAGVDWPGDELFLVALIVFFAFVSLAAVRVLRDRRPISNLVEVGA
jgi:uncharacterized membrane protein